MDNADDDDNDVAGDDAALGVGDGFLTHCSRLGRVVFRGSQFVIPLTYTLTYPKQRTRKTPSRTNTNRFGKCLRKLYTTQTTLVPPLLSSRLYPNAHFLVGFKNPSNTLRLLLVRK